MSHSLLSANAPTQVKIVIVALVGAILVVMGGIAAHLNTNRSLARLQAHAPVFHAGTPVIYTDQGRPTVR